MSRTKKFNGKEPDILSPLHMPKMSLLPGLASVGKVSYATEGVSAHLSVLGDDPLGLWLEVELSYPTRNAAVLVQALTAASDSVLKESFLMHACMCVRQWREAGLLSDEKALKALVREMGLVQAPVRPADMNCHPASSALH